MKCGGLRWFISKRECWTCCWGNKLFYLKNIDFSKCFYQHVVSQGRYWLSAFIFYSILEVNKWLFSFFYEGKILWFIFRIRKKADGRLKCLPHGCCILCCDLAHGGGDGLFFMVDVMGQQLSEHWRTSANACLSLCCSNCLYQRGVTVSRYGVLAFQA